MILHDKPLSYLNRIATFYLQNNMPIEFMGLQCEEAGLLYWTLVHLQSLNDIKRIIVKSGRHNVEWVKHNFDDLEVEQTLACLTSMM